MNHSPQFRTWLENRISKELPGESAQYKLAPFKRKEEEQMFLKKGAKPRKSAVLMILYPQDGLIHVPMIIRTVYDGVHSGQIGLPGGKFEEEDEYLVNTAIRETKEEISVQVDELEIIGQLSALFVPVSNFIIHPFIAWMDQKPEFKPEEKEVQEILEIPLTYMTQAENRETRRIKTAKGYSIKAPGIPIGDNFLWGATAMILSEFLEIIDSY